VFAAKLGFTFASCPISLFKGFLHPMPPLGTIGSRKPLKGLWKPYRLWFKLHPELRNERPVVTAL
jgi:hypothetical protein